MGYLRGPGLSPLATEIYVHAGPLAHWVIENAGARLASERAGALPRGAASPAAVSSSRPACRRGAEDEHCEGRQSDAICYLTYLIFCPQSGAPPRKR